MELRDKLGKFWRKKHSRKFLAKITFLVEKSILQRESGSILCLTKRIIQMATSAYFEVRLDDDDEKSVEKSENRESVAPTGNLGHL